MVQVALTRGGPGRVSTSLDYEGAGGFPFAGGLGGAFGGLGYIPRYRSPEEMDPMYYARLRQKMRLQEAEKMAQLQDKYQRAAEARQRTRETEALSRERMKAGPAAKALFDMATTRQRGLGGGIAAVSPLAKWLSYIGPERAHAGLMQSGRLLMQPGAGVAQAVQAQGGIRGMNEAARLSQGGSPVLGSREDGGGIPKTGKYLLHEGEQVIPAPEKLQEMMIDVMIDRQLGKAPKKRGKKGKKSYQTGTVSPQDMMQVMQQGGGQMPGPQFHGPFFGDFEGPPEDPIEPSLLETLPFLAGGWEEYTTQQALGTLPEPPEPPMAGESEQIREMTANPEVAPQQVLDQIAGVRRDIDQTDQQTGIDTSGYEGVLEEGRGAAGERSFKLTGSPYGRTEMVQDQYKRGKADVERLTDRARGLADTASRLLEYAAMRPNSPAYAKLREMAADKLKMAKDLESSAKQKDQQLEQMMAAVGQEEATKAAAEIEAAGRQGAAATQARGEAAKAGIQQQGDMAQRLTDLFKSYAGAEGVDPEAVEEQLRQLMQLFMIMGGFQDALGGGLPNG